MALASSVTGDGHVTSKSITHRYLTLTSQMHAGRYHEVKTVTVREWPACSLSAVESWVAAEKVAGESRAYKEDHRVLGSYIAEQTIETLTGTWAPLVPEEE